MNHPLASLSRKVLRAPPVRSIPMRRIALPTEHGGWGFLGEPLVAGLAIAFSPTAPWIALMVVGAFLLRQPLRTLIADRMGRCDASIAINAVCFIIFYSAIFILGLTGAVANGGWRPLMPFFIVLPLIAIQIYFDIFRRSRALLPETAGAISISASVAAIALAGGLSWPFAAALWLVLIARLIPSILYVRERLKLEKGKVYSLPVVVMAHTAALLLVTVLAFLGLVPLIVCGAMIILLCRAITGLSATRTTMRAMQIGVREVVYGSMTVIILVIGYYAGL